MCVVSKGGALEKRVIMRRSNCSAPIPRGSPGVRRKMCVINKGGALEKRVIRVFIQGGKREIRSDKETGATQKK